jgi:predicted RNA-binding protein with PUA-like domain
MVDIQFVEKFAQPLTLQFLRTVAGLKDMVLLRKGSRLSVQPVTADQYATIVSLTRS